MKKPIVPIDPIRFQNPILHEEMEKEEKEKRKRLASREAKRKMKSQGNVKFKPQNQVRNKRF